jgi:hypothetical protein
MPLPTNLSFMAGFDTIGVETALNERPVFMNFSLFPQGLVSSFPTGWRGLQVSIQYWLAG